MQILRPFDRLSISNIQQYLNILQMIFLKAVKKRMPGVFLDQGNARLYIKLMIFQIIIFLFKTQYLKFNLKLSIDLSSYIVSMISNKKQTHTQMSSLSTLGHSSQHSEATKKAISTQQISVESQTSNLERLASHHNIIVPFQINIKSLIKHLLLKLQQKGIIILHTDEKQGEILIQKQVHKNCWTSFLDCLCLCKKEGWAKGSITQSFEAVSIYIKRQYIEYRCSVKIRMNCPREKSSPYLLQFVEEILEFIKKCIESFRDSQEDHEVLQINEESPLAMQIAANEKAYQLFVSNGKQDKRYKTLYNTALEKIKYEMKLFKMENGIDSSDGSNKNIKQQKTKQTSSEPQRKPQKLEKRASLGAQAQTQKQKKIRISQITEMITSQSNNLLEFCRQLKIVSAPQFHPDYALYSIQNLFCYNLFPELFNLYKHDIVKNCEEFYKNAEYINKNLSSKQYFDYLEIRPKYRLQSSYQPYDLAINALRQLQTSLTLRQILLCVQKTFSLIKVCCLYEHDGKLDITAMDDILPVMIYVAARAQVIDFPVYVKIIDDYIKIRGVFQLEERVVTTLYVATEDISKKVPNVNKQ